MFTLEDVLLLLSDLGLQTTEENIKWGYSTLLKEEKLFIKMREFETTFDESLYEGECCGCSDDCECECCKDDCCDEGKCCCSSK